MVYGFTRYNHLHAAKHTSDQRVILHLLAKHAHLVIHQQFVFLLFGNRFGHIQILNPAPGASEIV